MERELADFIRSKYKLTEARIDALTPEEYDALCEQAIEERQRAEADLLKIYLLVEKSRAFEDWILSHRP